MNEDNNHLKVIYDLNKEIKTLRSKIDRLESMERKVDETVASKIFSDLEKTSLAIIGLSEYIDTVITSESDNIYERICYLIKNFSTCDSVYFYHTKIDDFSKLKHQSSFKSMNEIKDYLASNPAYAGEEPSDIFSFNSSEYIIEKIMKISDNGVYRLSNLILKLMDSPYTYYLLSVNGQVGEYYGYIVIKISHITDTITKMENLFSLLNRINSFILFSIKYIKYFNKLNQELENAIDMDAMTCIFNKGAMIKYGKELESGGLDFSIIAFDIDSFKLVNDNYGHDVGDKVIIKVAEIFKKYCTRINGRAFRFGGDEFFGIVTSVETRHIKDEVENFLTELRGTEIQYDDLGNTLSVTVSVGVSCNYYDYKAATKQADDNLYKVKKEMGKNNYYLTERDDSDGIGD